MSVIIENKICEGCFIETPAEELKENWAGDMLCEYCRVLEDEDNGDILAPDRI